MFIQYYCDKFCLMRLWSPGAFIGTQLAVFNRRYFLSAALLAFAIVSSYSYAEFPYDNLCDPVGSASGGMEEEGGRVRVTFWNGTAGEINVPGSNSPAIFCQQNYWLLNGLIQLSSCAQHTGVVAGRLDVGVSRTSRDDLWME